ncbi:MAG TPA: hypothetical protein VJ697_09405 [Nitrososphaeraceae archaeon]|nr:hypothetical protein [Nitrososphaeraceae archaeon]
MAIPSDILEKGGDNLFGRIIGIVDDENRLPVWIISGTWKTNLFSNQTKVGDNSTVFDASLNMIKTDGTSKHTHTLTNFVLAATAKQNNTTVFNGTGTFSNPDSSISNVPVNIKVLNQEPNIIYINPNKIDNFFDTEPIYGIPLEENEKYKKK